MTTLILAAALIGQCAAGACVAQTVQKPPAVVLGPGLPMTAPWCSLDGIATTPKATRRRSAPASGQQYQATAPTRRGLRLFRRCR